MAEMKEQAAAAARAHAEALEAAEAQAADARQLAALYEQQVADVKAQLQASQSGGTQGAPSTLPAARPAQMAGAGDVADPYQAASAAELLGQDPGRVAVGLQQQGKSYSDLVADYIDMVGGVVSRVGGCRLEAAAAKATLSGVGKVQAFLLPLESWSH
jgi:hypothetical protein